MPLACTDCLIPVLSPSLQRGDLAATRRVWKKGETVLREGEPARALYQLTRGTLRAELKLQKVHSTVGGWGSMLGADEDKAAVVGRLNVGDCFGERTMLLGGNASTTLVVVSGRVVSCPSV